MIQKVFLMISLKLETNMNKATGDMIGPGLGCEYSLQNVILDDLIAAHDQVARKESILNPMMHQ